MKKIPAVFFLVFLFTISLFWHSKTHAQESTIGYDWKCLTATKVASHKAEITSGDNQFLPANSDLYIAECFATKDGQNTCSTGDPATDSKLGLGGLPKGTTVGGTPSRIVHSLTFPLKSTTDGKIPGEPILWQSDVPPSYHTFWGLVANPGVIQTSNDPSIKLGSWIPGTSDEDCASLKWDPKGIVFDSKSLEPIDNFTVTLSDENNIIVDVNKIEEKVNPALTAGNGEFNFTVAPGWYYLKAEKSGFTFPSAVNPIPFESDPQFPYLMGKDVAIYRGEKFFEPPALTIKNIPVDPVGTPYTREADVVNWSCKLNKKKRLLRCEGLVTHPLSTVTFYNGGKVITQTQADAFGSFQTTIDTSKVNAAEKIKKPRVTKAAIFSKAQTSIMDKLMSPLAKLWNKYFSVSAQTTEDDEGIYIPLNYIEGYIIDPKTTKPLVNTKIQILSEVSSKPYVSFYTDNNGYLKIPSQYLPPFSFKLVAVNESDIPILTQTTGDFINSNKELNKESNIDYMQYRPEPNDILDDVNRGPIDDKDTVTKTPINDIVQQSPSSNMLLIFVMGVVFVVIVSAIVILSHKNKTKIQKQPEEDKEFPREYPPKT
jgi:hypothetical protein